MKRKSLLFVFLLSCSLVFASGWQIEEKQDHGLYYYTVTSTPEKNKASNWTDIFCWFDTARYTNRFANPSKERIIEYLENEKYEIINSDNKDWIFLNSDFMSVNYKISKKQLTYVYDLFEKSYAGLPAMLKKGFSKKKFVKIQNAEQLKEYLNKYIDDGHFYLRIEDVFFSLKPSFDEGSIASKDPAYTYLEKETSNAYYIRFNSCEYNPKNDDYNSKLAPSAYNAIKKDFIILDARSNNGGSDIPQYQLRKTLDTLDYKGTVIVLQDNWSFSSGEVWHIFGMDGFMELEKPKFKRLLIGTHSGGMQNYGNCDLYENKELRTKVYFGKTDFTETIPDNYLGDCKGYEPDIWATTQTMKETLEGLGVDLTGVEFQ
ncbi:MAG: hypothetical protein K6A15_08370 [Treponema sp.]|nr:hypothetical protein [Treponema sp.]